MYLWSNETFQTWSNACIAWKYVVLTFVNLRFVYLCSLFALCTIFRMHIGDQICDAIWRVQMCVCDQMKRSKRDPAHAPHENILFWSFPTSDLFIFVHFCILYYLSWCILAVRSAMKFDEYKCAFEIKWNVPKVIQRMHHVQICCYDIYQLALCLFCFC